ncbi:FAD/NAD(P)-binding domain-containing protein [Punctularia strigosozonata HHB-11173 SS5]|uniref:FAD/NAD(P)-binding domain-containing protein n=1 Tax=Punctularia strigosozonata (strain HHB-11173) TaxID=741275 RepID=UPI0004416482|nr:FAD/NAD(P)-binding domain-containing protein [Punctularia strigosozonata HHB-11173 SS5]EIN06705.1 FAD/NAD(P)-binding domain-containing protein [Punctularia strigosozonata HHB-11173 SS5]
MSATPIPSRAQILVIGGGPSGSYAASALAREGLDVVLLEAAQFPRYHIGESMIPSVRYYLRFIDAEEKVKAFGFEKKPGAAVKFNQYKQEGYSDFVALGPNAHSWNVSRADFDEILLRHAAESGAAVFERTRVNELHFSEDEQRRPISASYTRGEETGTISFDYLIDASGRAGILSTKYLKNRKFNESLKNIAIWGYWQSTGGYMKGTGLDREGAPYFEALTDESGWAWFIPLSNGKTSVGIVMNQKLYNERVRAMSAVDSSAQHTLLDRYLAALPLAPNVSKLIGKEAELIRDSVGFDEKGDRTTLPTIKMASDYSYSSQTYAGPGWRLAGDAGAFIDPFFSSGVHLAFTGGLSAAATVSASIRGDCDEETACRWHTERVSISYTRFLLVVLSAYKQIRSQSLDVLSDVDEDNFDRVFNFIRPVIQGAADMGERLFAKEVDEALDFCGKLFAPVSKDTQLAVRRSMGLDYELSNAGAIKAQDSEANVTPGKDGEGIVDTKYEEETKEILEKINQGSAVKREEVKDTANINNFEEEPIDGRVVRLERGHLGLVAVC